MHVLPKGWSRAPIGGGHINYFKKKNLKEDLYYIIMGFGIVYSITCNETGKIYVGATAIGLNQRISSHVCQCNKYDKGVTV